MHSWLKPFEQADPGHARFAILVGSSQPSLSRIDSSEALVKALLWGLSN